MISSFKINAFAFLALNLAFSPINALVTNPVTSGTKSVNQLTDRTFVTRDIKTPDPVPESGQQEALELMRSGRMYRYNIGKGEESVVSICEKEIADYTGFKYCVALNSCGSALMLLLKTSGLKHGEKVISNAFTFGAVPSAIEHAGGKAVYVESNYDHVMDVEDLEKKLKSHPDCRHVMVSHMRGKVGDMDAIKKLCDENEVILLEDCAHSLGVYYKNEHSGHHGLGCAVSSQSYKMINSGEGGFLLTNNPEMAAETAVYAGAYEQLNSKHMTVPGPEYFKDTSVRIPNYSLRMSNVHAAIIRPQIKTIDERTKKYLKRYNTLADTLSARVGNYLTIPGVTKEVTQMVHDSFQFNLDKRVTPELLEAFLVECADHGLPVENFGHKSNARNFVNWGFAPADDPLPMTAEMLSRACDVRMPLTWDDEDFEDMANVLCESLEKVLGEADLL